MGGKNGVYRYVSAAARRMAVSPKTPAALARLLPEILSHHMCLSIQYQTQANNFAFGNPLAPVNSVPKRLCMEWSIQCRRLAIRTTGANGARIDDMKGTQHRFHKGLDVIWGYAGKVFLWRICQRQPERY
jgi:hypothetical protein